MKNAFSASEFCLVSSFLRIGHWMSFILTEEFYWKDQIKNKVQRGTLLKSLSELAKFEQVNLQVIIVIYPDQQEIFPTCEDFLLNYLKTWNGKENFDEIMTLISNLRPYRFEELYEFVLQPLHRLFFASNAHIKGKILGCLTSLLLHWIGYDKKETIILRENPKSPRY